MSLLCFVFQKVRTDGTYDFPLTEAKSAINRPLNRYRDVLPYDHSRIILEHPTTNYINASLLKVESVQRQYILTQGPLSTTSQHFWLMVWQQQTKGIIMLNKTIEKNMIKCDQYWPLGSSNGGQDSMTFPGVGLQVDLVSEAKHHHYTYRVLRLTETSSGNSREVLHFHYTTWPDFGVPQSPEAFNKFLNVVIKSGSLDASVGPAIVHCSAGIGRSGTFCLVDTLLLMLDQGVCGSNVGTVLEVLLDMRRYRMGLIQTPDQLRFSYQAIVQGARQRLRQQQRATNGSLGNGVNPADDGSSSDEAEEAAEDAPPPRPPPRTDSLTRSVTEAQIWEKLQGDDNDDVTGPSLNNNHHHDGEDDDDDEEEEEEPLVVHRNNTTNTSLGDADLPDLPSSPEHPPTPPPPPRPPPARVTSPSDGDEAPSSPEELATKMACEVRRRQTRQERNASLRSKITAIQEKSRVTEAWEYRKRWILRPLLMGVFAVGVAGGVWFFRSWWSY
ncbi:tyrosine-protein phosphatase non-receptor type 2 isoform X2 [Hyalella azteca]|uniref:protein-tyrosine-phosphatase n=1 Tax=Hyalella azteca TaxID=294128 RepID=A0A979FMA5_HYAAZ|nr:tyrosine-protein phosphatase non-receptor type 2 isoform X2 [Hyalella azteca]